MQKAVYFTYDSEQTTSKYNKTIVLIIGKIQNECGIIYKVKAKDNIIFLAEPTELYTFKTKDN